MNNSIKKFSESGQFIIFFIILLIIIYNISPEYAFYLLILIFVGQLFFNYETLEKILKLGVIK